jgi:GNAT superfamily N-acetyltransferase
MSDIEIRIGEGGDVALAAALRWRWVTEELSGEPLSGNHEFIAATVTWAHEHRDTHTLFVATRDGEALGMTWVALNHRVPSPRNLNRVNGDLQSVYVVPEARGHGLGERLVRTALDWARDAGAEYARVHSSTGAVPMYVRAGFVDSPLMLEQNLRQP